MLTPQEVACHFIPAFFERLASNPAELSEMFSEQSSLVVVDFEYGTVEANGADIPHALEQLANIFSGCDISVESYTAVPLFSGVNVCVTVFAESKTIRHCLEFVTVLEAYGTSDYDSEAYFIRNQFVFRPGAADKEEPIVEDVPKPGPQVKVHPETVQAVAEDEHTQPKEERVHDGVSMSTSAAEEKEQKHSSAEHAPTVAQQQQQEQQQQQQQLSSSTSAKPKTWASLASVAPRGEQRQPLKVTVPGNGAHADAADTNAALRATRMDHQHASAAAAAGATKTFPKVPRAATVPIGDRLMFNIDYAVTDEEIKVAFGPLADNIVSLRNNSANGHVFLDFSDKEKVLDTLKANPPIVGAQKTRVNIYRQRTRQ